MGLKKLADVGPGPRSVSFGDCVSLMVAVAAADFGISLGSGGLPEGIAELDLVATATGLIGLTGLLLAP